MSPTVLPDRSYSRIRTLSKTRQMRLENVKPTGKVKKALENAGNRYVDFLYYHAGLVMLITGLIASLMTFIGIYFRYDAFTFNPRDGFETRGTPLADDRMALVNLMENMANWDDLGPTREKRSVDLDRMKTLFNEEWEQMQLKKAKRALRTTTTGEPFTINYDDYGSDDFNPDPSKADACMQFAMLGSSFVPNDYLMVLSKIIWRIDSVDKVGVFCCIKAHFQFFSLPVMKELCHLDAIISETVETTNITAATTKLPFSFNAPYYAMCNDLNSKKRCEDLTQNQINDFRESVQNCTSAFADRSGLCDSSIFVQLRNMILSKQFDSGSLSSGDPIYVASIMQLTISYDGSSNMEFYSTLYRNLLSYYSRTEHIRVEGLFFNMKDAFFQKALLSDCIFAAIAVALVILGILIYNQSVIFTVVVTLGLLLSVGSAYFLYTIVFGITFFPFVNLLVVVLIVAIGADDTFLLNYCYLKKKQELSCLFKKVDSNNHTSSTYLATWSTAQDEVGKDRCKEAIREALSHAAVAMFVTSATTAVAFFANAASDILVLRCFGIFAGATMFVNYIFVVTALPACIIFLETTAKCPDLHAKATRWPTRQFFSRVAKQISSQTIYFFGDLLPKMISKAYIPVILLFLAITARSTYSVVKTPGIRLPENNPMQILRSSHPFEWFDENSNFYFNSKASQERKFNFYVVFGLLPTR
ncbi:hypothetical protein L596_011684 [Steinernema carpocapsae]|uniref:SSD domain-containing protein n=1 Tax=Steinernema carpocapsae TaxID=34508 RepID=A0A4U5NUQ6_STECR|nr:hypothetical protein L596_011684 [Steinernema carpocapsae]